MPSPTPQTPISRRTALARLAGLGPLVLTSPAWTANEPGATPARSGVQALLRSLVADAERPITGVSVAWFKGQGPAEHAWAGWRTVAPEHPSGSLPIDANTLFRVASISKLAQALACLRLHEAGRLRWDEDLSGVWRRELRHPLHPHVPISARLLLSHRSGLLDRVSLPLASGDALRRLLADPTNWSAEEPGRSFRYSNLGSTVLATAMEAATEEPYDHLMQHWLFEPLDIRPSFSAAALSPTQRHHLATLYRRPEVSTPWLAQADSRSEPPHPYATAAAMAAVGDNASVHSPAGGLRASMSDLVRLAQVLAGQGRMDQRRVFSSANYQKLIEPQWTHGAHSPGETAGGLFRSWSLGLQHFSDVFDAQGGDRLHPRGGIRAYGHVGAAYGLLSGLIVVPARGKQDSRSLVYVINGTSQAAMDQGGRHSSLRRCEERIISTLLDAMDRLPNKA